MAPNRIGAAPLEPNRLAFAMIGVPNAGKTTTKNMMVETQVATSNVPFHTIEANLSSGCVLDPRCLALALKSGGSSRAVPSKFSLIDTPGIVSGLSNDAGAVSNLYPLLSQADALLQVCRAFEAGDVVHTDGDVDPVRDIEALQEELMAMDVNYATDQLQKKTKFKDEHVQQVLEKVVTCLQAGTPIRHGEWKSKEEDVIALYNFATSKPIVYLINLADVDFVRQKNKWLGKIARWINDHDAGAPIVPYCATFEEQLQSLEDDDARTVYMEEFGAKKSMREKIVDAVYEATGVIRFYTKLNDVAMVWSAPNGTRARQAAGVVHSNLEANFAGLEVASWDGYKSEDNEAALKQSGKLHQKGKDYTVADGDVVYFKSHASSPKNKPSSYPGSPVSTACSTPVLKSTSPVLKASSHPGSPVNKQKPSADYQRPQPVSFNLDD